MAGPYVINHFCHFWYIQHAGVLELQNAFFKGNLQGKTAS